MSRPKTEIPLKILDLETKDYASTLKLQLELWEKRKNNLIENTIILVEHPPVITLGARQEKNILLTDRASLSHKNIQLVNVRRGGGITAHNPGQLVCYPILDLKQLNLGISDYVIRLQLAARNLLEKLGLKSRTRKQFPGLWVDDRKIASIGVRVSKLISYHGIAININNDLSIFDHFVPCGLQNVSMTSLLKETSQNVTISKAKQIFTELLISDFSILDNFTYEQY